LVSTLSVIFFIGIWALLISYKILTNGFKYGLWSGLVLGISMCYVTCSFMPIPYLLPLAGFWKRCWNDGWPGLCRVFFSHPIEVSPELSSESRQSSYSLIQFAGVAMILNDWYAGRFGDCDGKKFFSFFQKHSCVY